MTKQDWEELAGLVHTILSKVYIEDRAVFERLAVARGATLEQLAAGAVAAAVRTRFSAVGNNGS